MAKADLKAVIDADATKFDREIDKVLRDMERLNREIGRSNREAEALQKQLDDRTAKALNNMGRGMVVFGAATLAGLGLATKAAVDWESAWTGVLKTVDGSSQQLEKLQADLRDMATRLPATHQEIAAVAEAAGQLGVATGDVAAFTEVMINLGETTNLTAEEAATSIAQMMNVMKTAPEDVGRLGSALVELGNNGASTEAEILEMAQRISGAGAVVGLTEHEVLALSNALASVGIKAEAGGSAVSTAIIKMADAVAGGTEAVDVFAETAGMSAEQFTQAFEEDPARAIDAFVQGLGRVDAAGGNVFAILDDVGLSSIRTRDAMLRLSGSGDLLAQSLEDGENAWSANTALVEEAEKRYDTAEAKIGIAKNTLVDLAIDIGGVLLPVVSELAESGADLINWFGDLPGPVKTAMTVLALLAGTASLAGGGFLLLAPKIAAAREQIQLIATTAPRAAAAMRAFTLAIPVVGALLAVAGGIAAIASASDDAGPSVSDATKALLDLSDGMKADLIADTVAAAQTIEEGTNQLDKMGFQARESGARWRDLSGDVRDARKVFEENLGSIDAALAGMVEGGSLEAADEAVKALADALGLEGSEVKALLKDLPLYGEALQNVDNETKLAAQQAQALDSELVVLANRFGLTGDDAEAAAQKLIDSWTEAGTEFVSVLGAYNDALGAKEEKERETAQVTADATEDTTDSWEDYVGDVELSVDEYIAQLKRMVENQTKWRDNLLDLSGRVSDGMLDHLVQLGPEGADLVALFASMSDKELRKAEKLWTNSTDEAVQGGIVDPVLEAGPVLAQIAADHGKKTANQVRDFMKKHGVGVAEAARELGVKIDKKLRDGEDRTVPVKVTGANRAIGNLESIREAIRNLPSDTQVKVGLAYALTPGRMASGGPVRGPGGPTDDKAGVYALSNGEYVMKAAAVQKYGPKMFEMLNAGSMPAQGGPVSKVNVKFDRDSFDAAASDFRSDLSDFSSRTAGAATSSGKVLPPGSYRIGRGPAAHGYNARDLPAPTGTPVYAAAAGIVSRAARLGYSYGTHARIGHAGWSSLYAHMSQMFVRAGQEVRKGQMIGRVGSTGNSTGPHLHLEPDNPRLYDGGGKWRTGTLGYNNSGGTEYVLSPDQSRMFDRFITVMEGSTRGGDGASSGFNYNVVVQSTTEEQVRKIESHQSYARLAQQRKKG